MDTKETCAHIWKQIYNPHSMVPDIEVGYLFDILIGTVASHCYSHIEDPVARNLLSRIVVKGEQSHTSFVHSVEMEVEVDIVNDGDSEKFDAKCEAEKKARIAALQSLTEKGLIKCVEDVYSLA